MSDTGDVRAVSAGRHGYETVLVFVDPRPTVPSWVSDVIAAIVVALAALAPTPGETYVLPPSLTLMLTVLAVLLLPLRRRWPLVVLGATLVLFGVVAFTGGVNPGTAIAAAIATHGVVSRRGRTSGFIFGSVALVAVIAVTLAATWGTVLDPHVVQFALAVVVGIAAGDATRSRRAAIAQAKDRAARAEEAREAELRRRATEERLTLARDLHDTVAHQISVISLNAGVATATFDARPERAREALTTIRSAARTVLGEIGDLLEVLRDDEVAATAPQPGLERLDDLVAQFSRDGLDVTFRIEGDRSRVTGLAGLVSYRVIQEALTNALKHGAEHRAHVLVNVTDDAVDVVVTNPVPLGAESRDAPGSRLGLVGLRERVTAARGTVEVGPAPGGWRVHARLPLTGDDASPDARPATGPGESAGGAS